MMESYIRHVGKKSFRSIFGQAAPIEEDAVQTPLPLFDDDAEDRPRRIA